MRRVLLVEIITTAALLLAGGCTRPDPNQHSTPVPYSVPGPATHPSTEVTDDSLGKFRKLRAGMTLEQTRSLLGLPAADPGSGQPMEIYLLPDQSSVILRFRKLRLHSVQHSGQELLTNGR